MQYNSSIEEMINSESKNWESVLEGSTTLLKKLKKYDDENYTEDEKYEPYHIKYIHVLFGLRSTSLSHEEFDNFISPVINCISEDYDAFEFHKKLRNLLADADSTLDYLDKLYKALSDKNPTIKFSRKESEVAIAISVLRNSYLHEGVPSINAGTMKNHQSQSCHANVASFTKSGGYVSLTFKINKNDTKDWEVQALKSYIMRGVKKLVKDKTNELISYFD